VRRGQKASRKSVLIAAGDPLKRRLISDVFAVHEKWPLSKHFSQSYSGTVAQLLDELLLKRIYFNVIVLDNELPGRSSCHSSATCVSPRPRRDHLSRRSGERGRDVPAGWRGRISPRHNRAALEALHTATIPSAQAPTATMVAHLAAYWRPESSSTGIIAAASLAELRLCLSAPAVGSGWLLRLDFARFIKLRLLDLG